MIASLIYVMFRLLASKVVRHGLFVTAAPDVSLEWRFVNPVELIERIRAGDEDAEAELVARFGPRVQAFVSARLSGSENVEDITQETLLAVLCALRDGKLREPAMLAAFVYGIARNQLADAIRKKARERLDPLPENREFAAPAAEREPELMEAARREIQALEPTDRRILWMTLIDGFKPGEIAAGVGLNVEAVRQRKSRALKKLIEKLQPLSRTRPAVPLTSEDRDELPRR